MTTKQPKELYFKKNGLYAYTSHMLQNDAFIMVETAVVNDSAKDQEVWIDIHMHQLIDTGKKEIAEEPGIKAAGAIKLFVPAGECRTSRTRICVENAVIWDVDAPVLYVVEAVLYKPVGENEALPNPKLIAGLAMREPHAMKMMDFEETCFGIRSITVDAKNGFCLNGRTVPLAGGLMQQAAVSAAVQSEEAAFDAEYQKVKKYKESGYNAVHVIGKQMTDDFFDACNRLGVLVLNEVSGEEEICHGRSFPCVAAWMISEACLKKAEDMANKSLELSEMVRMLDDTRFVGGICNASIGADADGEFDKRAWNDITESICAPWDVVGYPKENGCFEEASVLFPNRVIFIKGSKPEEERDELQKYSNVIGILE